MDAILYKYVVHHYLRYVRNSYLKQVFISSMRKKYGPSYQFNVVQYKKYKFRTTEVDILYNRHLPSVRNYENKTKLFKNHKNYYEPFAFNPFCIYLNQLIFNMSEKLKIYNGTRKMIAPEKCQFCLYQHFRENTHRNRNLVKLCYPFLNQATHDDIFEHMYDSNYMDNIDFS